MEKLKNMINPGSKKDDEVMYGSGQSDDPVHSGSGLTGAQSGQGSHFGGSRTAGNDPLSSSNNPMSGTSRLGSSTRDDPLSTSSNPAGVSQHDKTGTSGLGSNSRNDPLSTSSNPTGASQYDTANGTGRGTHGLSEPYASRMPGGFDDDAATTASVRSGVPGQTTQTGSGMTGTNDPTLTNKPLPREPATAGSGLTGLGNNTTGGSSLTGSSYPDRSVGNSGLSDQSTGSSHLGRDTALGAGAIGAGTAAHHHHHESAQRDNYTPESGRSFPLGGSPNTATGSNYPSGQTGTYGATGQNTSGPNSSHLANKADPRVDSDLDGSRAAGNVGYGFGTSANPRSANEGSLGRDATLGVGTGAAAGGLASGASGYGPESWEHDHNRHGHQYEGDPCAHGETTAAGPRFVPGPHATNAANLLDPHVAGGIGGTESTTGNQGHHGLGHKKEDAVLAGGATGAGLGAHDGNRGHHGNTTGSSTGTGLGPSDGPAPNTAGPHKSDMLNKLDPHVDSDLSTQRGSTDTGLSSSKTGTTDPYSSQTAGSEPNVSTTGTGRDHHLGRDASLGAGAGGLAYEAERHYGKPSQSSSVPGHITGSTYDNPRGPTGYEQAGSQLAGSSQQPLTGQDHHLGRDAALGAGAGGLAYEAEKDHHKDNSSLGSTPQDQLAGSGHQSGRDHHLGRDAAIGGAALGAGAAGVDEYQRHRETGRVDPVTNVREHQHPGASLATYPSPGYGNERDLQQNSGHHGHRKEEEALVGGAAAGGLAHHEHSKRDDKALEKEHSKEVKQHDKALAHEEKAIEKDEKHHEKERAKHMAAIEKDQKKHEHELKKHEHDGEKKHGGLLGFLHKDKHDKHDKHIDQPHAGGQVAHDRQGADDGMSTGTGQGSYDQPLEGGYGSQPGVHDSSLGGSGTSTIGSGTTTHDAYGTHEGHNRLHKDPPAKVLEARGQDYQGHSNVK